MESQLIVARELAAKLGIAPLYLVSTTPEFSSMTEGEKQFFDIMAEGAVAFTSPIADLMFKNGALRYEWQGRGCCVVFCYSPLTMSETEVCGILLHEMGHWVADCDKPERDDTDHLRAAKAAWNSMEPDSKHHDKRWLTATVNLWHRSCRMGYEIPLSNVVKLKRYGFDRKSLAPILDEASRREHVPIEKILPRRSKNMMAKQYAGRSARQSDPKLVSVIPVLGELETKSYNDIGAKITQALNDEKVGSIVLYIDSPGGMAIGCKPVADLIYNARGQKPITAFVQGLCASAAYYIAAACDSIEATADSLVGSVGTIFPHSEYSGYLKEEGINYTVFTNTDSPKKGHGNIYEPLTDDSRETLQNYVDSYGRPFIEDVARYRGVSAEDVTSEFGQGNIVRADIAIKFGLVDQIVGGFSETFATAAASFGATNSAAQIERELLAARSTRRPLLQTWQPMFILPSAMNSQPKHAGRKLALR